MNSPIQTFYSLLKQVEQLPFSDQEAFWNESSFFMDDFAKRFPPTTIKAFTDLFGTLDKETTFDIRDKAILEVGPGFSLGVAFCVALSGARKVYAVDAYPHPKGSDHDFIASMFTHLFEERSCFFNDVEGMSDDDFTNHFANLVSRDMDGRFCFKKDKIELFFPYFVEKLPFSDEVFDLVYSSASFEHFRMPQQAAKELFRVTKPGGMHLHSIDLRDHRNFKKPLDFLTLDEDQWQALFSNASTTSYSYTNRLRGPEIIECFEREGFSTLKVLPFMRCSVKDDLLQNLAYRFKAFSKEDLGITSCRYIFKKK